MLLSPSQIKVIEDSAFSKGIDAESLMERAGRGIARIVSQFHSHPGRLILWCGKGNNAGDILVAGRILAQEGWGVEFFGAFPETALGKLPARKLAELRQVSQRPPTNIPLTSSVVVLEGLLGIGARGPLSSEICKAIIEIQRLRREKGAWVLSADIPTGLDGETGKPNSYCIQADLTATIGFVKTGLLADTATTYVGRLALVSLPELNADEGDSAELITSSLVSPWLPLRSFDSHKGTYGRVGILAGSHTFPGAARLCAYAALRAGAGYVILFAPKEMLPLLASSLPAEVIIHPIDSFQEVLQQPLSALCIGPGLGIERKKEILEVVQKAEVPSVLDADALNALIDCPKVLNECRGARLLTPHPREFARLAPELSGLTRRKAAETFTTEYQVTLLLKGARTLIAEQEFPTLFNSTGNPGMASAGMGDVLTGVCGALLAQKLTPRQAASIGSWLCGRAAESAIFSRKQSPESLLAGDIIQNLGYAFNDLRKGVY